MYLDMEDLPGFLKAYCKKNSIPYVNRTSHNLGNLLRDAGLCAVYGEKRIAKRYRPTYGNTRLVELPLSALQALPEL